MVDRDIDPSSIDLYQLSKLMISMNIAEPEQVVDVMLLIIRYTDLSDSYYNQNEDGYIPDNLDFLTFEYLWSFATGCCSGKYRDMLAKSLNATADSTADGQERFKSSFTECSS